MRILIQLILIIFFCITVYYRDFKAAIIILLWDYILYLSLRIGTLEKSVLILLKVVDKDRDMIKKFLALLKKIDL